MKKLCLIITVFLCLPLIPKEKQKIFQSAALSTPLIELYSSEGCSSCPPADQFFTYLRKRRNLWKDFVPVGFHVDYWDRLGWVDKLAQTEFTRRQRRYARQWNSKTVYTPGLVFNGNEWKGWSSGVFPKTASAKVGSLKITSSRGHRYKVEFSPVKGFDDKQWVLSLALLGNSIYSKILAGENRGRTLRHEFVVLDWKKTIKKSQGLNSVHAYFKLEPNTKLKVPQYSIAAWVNIKGDLKPIQSIGGDL